jgi:hypothetical protein
MNLDDGTVAVINNTAAALPDVKATARVYNLDGTQQCTQEATLNAVADACTQAFSIAWPDRLSPAHFVKLELRDAQGKLLSDNFYWRGVKNEDLLQLNTLPKVSLTGETKAARSGGKALVAAAVKNPSGHPVLMVKLTLRAGKSNQRVLPAYCSDNYFSLLPDEGKTVTIECAKADLHGEAAKVTLDGWNVVPGVLP